MRGWAKRLVISTARSSPGCLVYLALHEACKRPMGTSGHTFPHLPHPLHTPAGCQDAVLRWFEEYASRLEAGWYGVEPQAESLGLGVGLCKGICLFPKVPPQMVTAVTRGVQVRL